jgi:very-short-patch-repair endonuclease
MAWQSPQQRARAAWALARSQHGAIALFQLSALGYTRRAIEHRLAIGRLHPVYRGVYAIGRPDVNRKGRWMAALLACRLEAVLSHHSAAALWGIRADGGAPPHVTTSRAHDHRQPGIVAHRSRTLGDEDVTRREDIPLTTPLRTLVDLGTQLPFHALEAAINEADKLDLIDPVALRAALDERKGQRGVRPLRDILDRGEFVLTDSELERRFLPIARRAGLAKPLTQRWVNGCRVDFYWPDLGLVVETDGLRYHRTPSQQTKDRVRDQAHVAAGLTPLRFTHWQVRYDPTHVERTLQSAARRARPERH